jgi:hypothetical protein
VVQPGPGDSETSRQINRFSVAWRPLTVVAVAGTGPVVTYGCNRRDLSPVAIAPNGPPSAPGFSSGDEAGEGGFQSRIPDLFRKLFKIIN